MDEDLRPLVTCPNAEIGDETSPRWRLAAAVLSRSRAERVRNAEWCKAHEGDYDEEQYEMIVGILDGTRDHLLWKELEQGWEPE